MKSLTVRYIPSTLTFAVNVHGSDLPEDAAVDNACNWAVLGPGAIARKFISQLPASRTGRLVAVGSSDPGRAEALAAEAGGDVRAGSYEEILADPAVNAVYISTVHTIPRPLGPGCYPGR